VGMERYCSYMVAYIKTTAKLIIFSKITKNGD